MIDIVDKFLDKHNLKSPDNTFLVGFSGGCDSLCLLDILIVLSKKYGFRVVALHLNHNWRGAESDMEEKNCKRFCETNKIECVIETLPEGTPKNENFARQARYDFFLKYAKLYSNSSIFTAHTRSDNVETIIYRMIKGTGIKGLCGIKPVRMIEHLSVYRPLLPVSRDKIEGYCMSKGLVANTDSSNFNLDYKRNFIRQKIIPLFKEINYNAESSIDSLIRIANSQSNIVNEYLAIVKKDIYDGRKLITEKFMKLSDDVKLKIIYDACLRDKLDVDYKRISHILDFIKENAKSKAGSRYSLAAHLWVYANSKNVYLISQTEAEKNIFETKIYGEGEYYIEGTRFKFEVKKFEGGPHEKFPPEHSNYAHVELEDFSDLVVRTRRAGDYIVPFGMNGTMKLKKYLNAKAVPQHQKDELVMLAKGSEILWVIGVGLSNKLKVVNKTTHVLELRNIN